MIRELSISNGRLLFNFDDRYQLCELYLPSVRRTTEPSNASDRFGFAVDGKLLWTAHPSWRIRLKFLKETQTSSVSLANNRLQVVCYCSDVVDFRRAIFVRRIKLRNLVDYARKISVIYLPHPALGRPSVPPIPHSVKGLYLQRESGDICLTGFWRGCDGAEILTAAGTPSVERMLAEWGEDQAEPVNGADRSLVRTDCELQGFQEDEFFLVMMLARSDSELNDQIDRLKRTGPQAILDQTSSFWRLWVSGTNINFGNLPGPIVELFKRSLLTLRSWTNSSGMPANTSSDEPEAMNILTAATVAHALDLAGLPEPARWFYRHCRRLNLPGKPSDPGRSPSAERLEDKDDRALPSIQPAGPAVVLWGLWRHYFRYRDIEYLRRLWDGLICRWADALIGQYDEHLERPRPAPDLWQRGIGVDGFTLGATYGGLIAAKNFAICFGDSDRANRYEQIAAKFKVFTEQKLYSNSIGRFGSALWLDGHNGYQLDDRLDSGLFGLVRFGMFEPRDPQIVSTVNAICDRLWVNTPTGGLARFDGDHDAVDSPDLAVGIPGWPSVVSTIWLTQYLIDRTQQMSELRQVLPLFEWILTNASSTGMLPTGLDPVTGERRPDQPDLLAHGEFAVAVIAYLEKLEHLQICSGCGQSVYRMRRHWPLQVRLQALLDKYKVACIPEASGSRVDHLVVFEHNGREATLAIDIRECIGCGVCTINCRKDILTLIDDKAQVDLDKLSQCDLCLECQHSCPIHVIKITHSTDDVQSR